MQNIGIYGARGRMGKRILECLINEKLIPQCYDRGGNLVEFFNKSEAIIDFSSPNGTKELLHFAQHNPKPLVIGTTGLNDEIFELLKSLAENMPVFYATNMSLGVAVLNHLASKASVLLRNFDIEISELHHRYKKDAPSGTAMSLAQKVAQARNLDLKQVRVSGRDGIIGERNKDEIAIMSLRGGDIVGKHTIGFYDEGEFLELSHSATSRATFAKGAIQIALWLYKQKPKFYSMDDFLGF
ncbi:4-hydroxy-tetrahydrodipicolinate reductase [Campylobacter sp. MIT 21-1685]|uniref:4-hydroxy-tetrahydrodipicolinate reductase n=1 Tax=unclassified Campylobacter TaxID=2593542 RepID=UPI00224A8433|nr:MULTISPECIES: 4-hydroxy-tetrahydrodipicolinate reductase [unclassified Campylobacter]MCX2683820.1 4-hydroxy-tetrahydrodipicolinate reductase [Campylobacter sp. MIT 21-1684]MCX2752108.1 4-hydroxy-tetrahydrodipicolinate reductase [Campylobacter sp. MIT 21-1682]MCX2808297.1 4-hydroxy-tetrahydrodipicolinate reductase [Campylobacter sp. MIT 21-1685]